MNIKGRVHKFGDHVDTDVIIPARYLNQTEPVFLASHCMEDIDPGFSSRVREGDIMVGGLNFGCGSSREHAPIAIKAAGVSCVIARTFARIFYRNAINIGLTVMECPKAAEEAATGDEISVDTEKGEIINITRGTYGQATPFPPFMRGIIDAGGLVEYTRARINK